MKGLEVSFLGEEVRGPKLLTTLFETFSVVIINLSWRFDE